MFIFLKQWPHYTTPCLQNSFPLPTIILQVVRFSFLTQTEITELGHTDVRLHKIVLKTGAE